MNKEMIASLQKRVDEARDANILDWDVKGMSGHLLAGLMEHVATLEREKVDLFDEGVRQKKRAIDAEATVYAQGQTIRAVSNVAYEFDANGNVGGGRAARIWHKAANIVRRNLGEEEK